jgi:3-methylfumaryl-CoA hydratase
MQIPLNELHSWIGKTTAADDIVTLAPARALAATLEREVMLEHGHALPPPWHWLYHLTMSPMGDVGPDGHPKRGGFLPPVPLPRRMWAGSRMEFYLPLHIGDAIHRVSSIVDVTLKEGRSGPLVFVKIRHEILGPAGPALIDEHDIVYRDMPRAGETPPPPTRAPAEHDWMREIRPDPVLLFRYSALTYNSHRIHYDHPYVTGVEGYPGLIVHGPLLATLLLDLLLRNLPRANVLRFSFRALRPVFDTAPFFVCGGPADDGKTVLLWAKDGDDNLCMNATAQLA